jgi:hydrogenase maturation protease
MTPVCAFLMPAEETMAEATRKVVLGLGNTLNRDEGVGVQALSFLTARLGPHPDIEILDGGTLGLNLLPLVESCSHLLVLDAINAGKQPGAVVELRRDEIPLYAGVKLSEHQITFQEVLGLAHMRGKLPLRLHMIGVQPADMTLGLDLSSVVQDALPLLVERALAVLHEWELDNGATFKGSTT